MPQSLIIANIIRISGLTAFVLLFVQIMLGFFLPLLSKKVGEGVKKFHFILGVLVFLIVLVHPISFVALKYVTEGDLDPYAAFINACLLCKSTYERVKSIGIIAFWFIGLSVFMEIMRNVNTWYRRNWKYFHLLNYVVFIMIGVHGFYIGTTFSKAPFIYFAVPAMVIIVGIFLLVELPCLYKDLSNWRKN